MLRNNGCRFSRTGENHESTNLETWYILRDKLKRNSTCIIANQHSNQEKKLQSKHTTYNETDSDNRILAGSKGSQKTMQ